MSEGWAKLEAAVERLPDVQLRPPASREAIAAAQFRGSPRPVPLQNIWGVHDGSDGSVIRYLDMRLLSLEESLAAHGEMLQWVLDEDLVGQGVAQDGSKPEVFTAGWIPVAEEEERLLCIDLDPEDLSRIGQVIEVHLTEGLHGRFADDFETLLVLAAESIHRSVDE